MHETKSGKGVFVTAVERIIADEEGELKADNGNVSQIKEEDESDADDEIDYSNSQKLLDDIFMDQKEYENPEYVDDLESFASCRCLPSCASISYDNEISQSTFKKIVKVDESEKNDNER